MIGKEELRALAGLKRLNETQIEKDYLQNLLLYFIYSVVGKELVFKGGTCLYKLHSLNRFSEDLDFSFSKNINFEKRLEKLVFLFRQTGIKAKIKSIDKYQNQLSIGLEFLGPFFDGNPKSLCFIRLDISLREKVLLEPKRMLLYSNYPDIPAFHVFAIDLHEIILEKILAIYSRKKARDVYDLWFLLKFKNIQIDFSLLGKKFRKHKTVFEKNIFLKKIEEKRKDWKKDLMPLIMGNYAEFEQVKKDISDALEKQIQTVKAKELI